MSDLKKIWQTKAAENTAVPEEQLLAYLQGSLSAEEQREIEALMADEGLMSDAVEGLKDFEASEVQQRVGNINYSLKKQLKSRRRRRASVVQNRWVWFAIMLVLLLAVLGYVVVRLAV